MHLDTALDTMCTVFPPFLRLKFVSWVDPLKGFLDRGQEGQQSILQCQDADFSLFKLPQGQLFLNLSPVGQQELTALGWACWGLGALGLCWVRAPSQGFSPSAPSSSAAHSVLWWRRSARHPSDALDTTDMRDKIVLWQAINSPLMCLKQWLIKPGRKDQAFWNNLSKGKLSLFQET